VNQLQVGISRCQQLIDGDAMKRRVVKKCTHAYTPNTHHYNNKVVENT